MRIEIQHNETWNHLGELISVEIVEITYDENDNEIDRKVIENE
jgi:hypothetical protein